MQLVRALKLALFVTASAGCQLALGLDGYDFGDGSGSGSGGAAGSGGQGTASAGGGGAGAGSALMEPPDADWAVGFGDTAEMTVNAVAVRNNGNVLITGRKRAGLMVAQFGCKSNDESGAGYIVELESTTGNCVWAQTFGASAEGTAVAVTPTDGIVLAGSFSSMMKLSTTMMPMVPVQQDGFVALFDKDHKFIWAQQIRDVDATKSGDQSVTAAAASEGYITIAGDITAKSSVTPPDSMSGPGLGDWDGGKDAFAVLLDVSGAVLTARFIGGSGDQTAHGAAMGSGQHVIAGVTEGFTRVNGTPYDNKAAGVYHLATPIMPGDPYGGVLSSTQGVGRSAVGFDEGDNVILAGEFSGKLVLSGIDSPESNSDQDLFVLSNTSGSPFLQLGSSESLDGARLGTMAVRGTQAVVVGDFKGSLLVKKVDGSPIEGARLDSTPVGGFIVKIDTTTMSPLWVKGLASAEDVHVDAAALTKDSTIVAGRYTQYVPFDKIMTDAGKGVLPVSTYNIFIAKLKY